MKFTRKTTKVLPRPNGKLRLVIISEPTRKIDLLATEDQLRADPSWRDRIVIKDGTYNEFAYVEQAVPEYLDV